MGVMRRWYTVLIAVLVLALPASSAADEGPFGGFDLALAVANFDAPSSESTPYIGALVSAELGWRYQLGIDVGVSLGLSGAGFGFGLDTAGLGMPGQMEGAPLPPEVDADVSLDMLCMSGWVFVPLTRFIELHGRIGGGRTWGELSAGTLMVEKRGWGVVTTGGVAVQVRPSLVLISEVYWRQYGFTLDGFEGFEDDLYSYGITAGVGWRP